VKSNSELEAPREDEMGNPASARARKAFSKPEKNMGVEGLASILLY